MLEVLISLQKIAAKNYLYLSFFGQESKSSCSNGSFLLLNLFSKWSFLSGNGNFYNAVLTLTNVVDFNVENGNVLSILQRWFVVVWLVNPNTEINKVVSTLIWGWCRNIISSKTTLKRLLGNKKKWKKINCQKICHCLHFTRNRDRINSFQVEFPSLYCLKTSANLYFLTFLGG